MVKKRDFKKPIVHGFTETQKAALLATRDHGKTPVDVLEAFMAGKIPEAAACSNIPL